MNDTGSNNSGCASLRRNPFIACYTDGTFWKNVCIKMLPIDVKDEVLATQQAMP